MSVALASEALPRFGEPSSFDRSSETDPVAETLPRLPPRSRAVGRARRGSISATGILPEAPAIFPWLARHFTPGEATIWWGSPSAVEPLLELLYVGSALAGGSVSLIEGANRFHPYRIGALGRSLGMPPEEVLARVRLARAFTAHQLVGLVDAWSVEARRQRPTLLVAHELPALFETDEVNPEERRALLTHVARTLGSSLSSTGAPLLLVLANGFERFPGLLEEGPPFADILELGRSPSGLSLRSYRDALRVQLVRRPDGQRGIEEFAPPSDRGEVIPWAAPSLPTDRRSMSG